MPAAKLIGNGPTNAAAANHHQVTIFEITEQYLKSKYLIKNVQLDHSNVAYVMDSVFINIQLTINNCLSKGFPDQINESFLRMYRWIVMI